MRLATSGIPTCVIWGRDDHITPAKSAAALEAMLGSGSTHILESVGHLPFAEQPAIVAAILARHFRSPS